MKGCCFIGHRVIDVSDSLIKRLKILIESLIVCENVCMFLFGSNSQFNDLCLEIVTNLQKKYPHIKTIAYECKSEIFFLKKYKEYYQKIMSNFYNKRVDIMTVDEKIDHKTKFTAGKASYVERNQAMIDSSHFCVFYYNQEYLPQKRKHTIKHSSLYQPQSGTKLAYLYALKKHKKIFNVFYENFVEIN